MALKFTNEVVNAPTATYQFAVAGDVNPATDDADNKDVILQAAMLRLSPFQRGDISCVRLSAGQWRITVELVEPLGEAFQHCLGRAVQSYISDRCHTPKAAGGITIVHIESTDDRDNFLIYGNPDPVIDDADNDKVIMQAATGHIRGGSSWNIDRRRVAPGHWLVTATRWITNNKKCPNCGSGSC